MAVPGAAPPRLRRRVRRARCARGLKLAAARGVTAVHDKDGGLGALAALAAARGARRALAARLAVGAARAGRGSCARSASAPGFGSPLLRLGYLKVFMDGTLGSQTAWMLDGSGVQITSGEELAAIVRRAAEAGFPVAVHAIGDRANREALDAFERTRDAWAPLGLRQRIEHAQLLAPEDLPRFAAARRRGVGAVLARAVRPRSRRPVLGGQDRRRVRLPLAAGTRARSSRTARTRRSRSSTRSPASARACGGRSTTASLASGAGGDRAAGVRGDVPSRRRGSPATSGAAAGCSRATPPISSCSTATRGTTSTRRSWRRWSPAGGCTTRRPGTEPSRFGPPVRDMSGVSAVRSRRIGQASARARGRLGQSAASARNSSRRRRSRAGRTRRRGARSASGCASRAARSR